MKHPRTIAVATLMLLACNSTWASEWWRTNEKIVAVMSISGVRPASIASQNYVRITLAPAAWGSSTCNQQFADISKTDSQLTALLYTAYALGKAVSIGVDDTRISVADICIVSALQVQ